MLAAFLGAVALGITTHYAASHSEAVAFANNFLINNEKVIASIGDVMASRLGFLENSFESWGTNGNHQNEKAHFTLILKGQEGSANAEMWVVKENGKWRVQEGKLWGERGDFKDLLN